LRSEVGSEYSVRDSWNYSGRANCFAIVCAYKALSRRLAVVTELCKIHPVVCKDRYRRVEGADRTGSGRGLLGWCCDGGEERESDIE